MNNSTKTFGIYCSDGASRVLRFYSFKKNLLELKPQKVIYDGNRTDVILKLTNLFGDDLIIFDNDALSLIERKKINSVTSMFIYETLKKYSIEYLLCFGNRILKKELIMKYAKNLINFHPAILPSFKGKRAIDQALEFETSFLGNTAHFIDEGIDTGKIIIQSIMLKSEFEDYEDVLELQFPMIKLILRDLLNYRIPDAEIFIELSNRKKQMLMPEKCNIS